MRDQWIRECQFFYLVFSITSQNPFEGLYIDIYIYIYNNNNSFFMLLYFFSLLKYIIIIIILFIYFIFLLFYIYK